ncbi:YvcK family protein, partial [Patescibacteria group bacterium]|nr:YvcK family protein [Patescibacteria group bacterium]
SDVKQDVKLLYPLKKINILTAYKYLTFTILDVGKYANNIDVVKTESAIDRPNYDLSIPIKKVWLEPPGVVYPDAVEAIERADIIIFGPGSLYTSVVAAILPNGVKEALNKSKAEYAFVTGNAYSADGETCPRTLSETVLALEKYLPRRVDLVLYGNHKLNDLQKENYKKRKWAILEDDKENTKNMNVIRADYERDEGGLCAIRLGKIFKDILWK